MPRSQQPNAQHRQHGDGRGPWPCLNMIEKSRGIEPAAAACLRSCCDWCRHEIHNYLTHSAQRRAQRASGSAHPSPDLGRTVGAQIPERAARDVAREIAQQCHILRPPRAARRHAFSFANIVLLGRPRWRARSMLGSLRAAVTAVVVFVRGRQRIEMLPRHDCDDIGLTAGGRDGVQRELAQRREGGRVL